MNLVQIDNVRRSLPACWNDLTRSQLLYVSRLFCGQLTWSDFKVKALREFLSIRSKTFRRIKPEDAFALCETFDFLTGEVTLTRNVIPVIRIGLRKY